MEINALFQLAAEKNASDIHLLFDSEPIFRIDGKLLKLSEINSDAKAKIEKISKLNLKVFMETILSEEQKDKFLENKDFDVAHQVNGYRFRVNFSFEKENIAIVARVVNNEIPTLEQIDMPKVVEELLDLPQGFILVTGPTGCGKSTTLAAMVEHINNKRGANIITLEDPTEFIFEPKKSIIAQRELGVDMNHFSSGLKYALRQDPNVIMIGEMRDLETISTAVTLAETGHLVLATLHTCDASHTIDRIIDTFPPHQQGQIKSQLSAILTGIISQRLLPGKDGSRVVAREILLNNSAIANLIREGKIAQIKSTIETNASMGMSTMDRSIKELYENGYISRETAMIYLDDKRMLPQK